MLGKENDIQTTLSILCLGYVNIFILFDFNSILPLETNGE